MAHTSIATQWRDRVSIARTPGDVFTLCQVFIAEQGPQRLAALPPSCLPPASISRCDDIAEYALRLSLARLKERYVSEDLEATAMVFEEAALRLATLLAVQPAVRLFVGGLQAR